MKSILSSAIAIIAIFSVHSAVAQNPHFVKRATFSIGSNTICFTGKVAGLGSNQTYTICLEDAIVTGTVDCRNGGGQINATKTKVSLGLNNSSFTGTTDAGGNLLFSGSVFCASVSVNGNPCPNPNWTPEVRSGTASLQRGTLNVYSGSGCGGAILTSFSF